MENTSSYEEQIEELKERINILEHHLLLRDMTSEEAFEIMSNWRHPKALVGICYTGPMGTWELARPQTPETDFYCPLILPNGGLWVADPVNKVWE